MLRTWRSKTLLVLVLLAIMGLVAWRGYDHLDHDPAFCGTCHRTSAESWLTHEGEVCQTCHTLDMGDRFTLAVRWLVRQHREVPRHTELAAGTCDGCHRPEDPRWASIQAEPGHLVHAGRAALACLKCHHPEYHGFRPESQDCKRCHTDRCVHPPAMQGVPCVRCHSFLAEGRTSLFPLREDCLDCHAHDPTEAASRVVGAEKGFECALCHDPHRRGGPRVLSCQTCHESMDGLPQHASVVRLEDCTSCHQTHHWAASASPGSDAG